MTDDPPPPAQPPEPPPYAAPTYQPPTYEVPGGWHEQWKPAYPDPSPAAAGVPEPPAPQPSAASPWGAPPAPPAPPTTPPPSGWPAGLPVYTAAHPRAGLALTLGLVGLIGGCLCWLPLVASPFAWVIGGRAVKEIDRSQGTLAGRGNAQAGRILGMIGTALLVIGVLVFIAFIVTAIVTESVSTTCTTSTGASC